MSKEELISRIENNHMFHSETPQVASRFHEVRLITEVCAKELVKLCPEGRELSLALTHLEEAMFWANAAIARNTK